MATIIVLGGGITGLTTTYYLSTLGREVLKKIILVEKTTRLGGWIRSSRYPDGTVHEHGPRSLRPVGKSGINTLNLVDELGLSDKVIYVPRDHPAAQNRLLLVNNKLYPVPNSFGSLFKTTPPFSKPLIVPILKDLFTRKQKVEDESVHQFTARRFNEELAHYITDPMCRGICAGSSQEISIRSFLPSLFKGEQLHGSVTKGQIKLSKIESLEADRILKSDLSYRSKLERWATWTLRGGLQQLIEILTERLEKDPMVDMYYNEPCSDLSGDDNSLLVSFAEDTTRADHVFSCLPSRRLSRILTQNYPSIARLLSQIPSVHVACVNLEFKGRVLPQQAFGFLVPSREKSNVLGIVFDSCSFPEHDGQYDEKTRITCMMGGRWYKTLFGDINNTDQEKVLESALESTFTHLNIKEEPVRYSVNLLKNCIPQYVVGHHKLLCDVKEEMKKCNLNNISLLGASYEGVGINDCIYNAKVAVESYLKTLQQ